MRYFFHVHDGHVHTDTEGAEFSSLDKARQQAVKFAGNVLSDEGLAFWEGEDWYMVVADDAGRTMFTLNFRGKMCAAGRAEVSRHDSSAALKSVDGIDGNSND